MERRGQKDQMERIRSRRIGGAQDGTGSVDISRENRFAANALALSSGRWDVTERDGTGRHLEGRDG